MNIDIELTATYDLSNEERSNENGNSIDKIETLVTLKLDDVSFKKKVKYSAMRSLCFSVAYSL